MYSETMNNNFQNVPAVSFILQFLSTWVDSRMMLRTGCRRFRVQSDFKEH